MAPMYNLGAQVIADISVPLKLFGSSTAHSRLQVGMKGKASWHGVSAQCALQKMRDNSYIIRMMLLTIVPKKNVAYVATS